MAAKIIDGRKYAKNVLDQLKKEIVNLKKKPGLAVIIVGNNAPSHTYVKMKKRCCDETGIYSEIYNLKSNVSERRVINLINRLNQDSKIHGILLQLPLPGQLNKNRIINQISPEKDVDGFHPDNLGKLAINEPLFIPCTPLGIIELLKIYRIKIRGKKMVIVGCSNVVGKPLGINLCETATVTFCHILTKNLKEHTLGADILITAAGKPKLIKSDMVKRGCVVIDAGFSHYKGKVYGDVDFEKVRLKASYITPVPGGVGPMTISMLMRNTVKACRNILKKNK